MLFILSLLFSFTFGQNIPSLTLGYPTVVRSGPNTPCVLKVDVPVGTTALRIYADKGFSFWNILGSGTTRVSVGREYPGNPPNIDAGSGNAVVGEENGDVMVTVDVGGIPGPWWIVVESGKDRKVSVSAVAYDLAQQPRVKAISGRRTGIIAVPFGSSEIYRLELDGQREHSVELDLNAGWLGAHANEYEIYVSIIDRKKVLEFLNNLSFADAADFLKKLSEAAKSGDLSDLVPALMNPNANEHDVYLKVPVSNLFGKTTFQVGASPEQDPLVYIAIFPKGGFAKSFDWSRASSFTVAFSVDGQKINKEPEGQCIAPTPGKKRDVRQQGDACANKICQDCAADDNCQYCNGDVGTESHCRAKTSSCPANVDAVTSANKDMCTRCISAPKEKAGCEQVGCAFCTTESFQDIVQTCVEKHLCKGELIDKETNTGGSGNAGNGGNGDSAQSPTGTGGNGSPSSGSTPSSSSKTTLTIGLIGMMMGLVLV